MLPRITLAGAIFAVVPVGTASSVALIGFGVDSCASWTQEHKGEATPRGRSQESWVMGYLSGQVDASGNSHALVNVNYDDLVRWITNYCAQHPADKITDASLELYVELSVAPK